MTRRAPRLTNSEAQPAARSYADRAVRAAAKSGAHLTDEARARLWSSSYIRRWRQLTGTARPTRK